MILLANNNYQPTNNPASKDVLFESNDGRFLVLVRVQHLTDNFRMVKVKQEGRFSVVSGCVSEGTN